MIPGRTANAIQTMKVCQALDQIGHEVELWLPDFGQEFSWEQASSIYGVRQPFPVHRLPVWMPLGRYDFSLRAVLQARRWGADLLYLWPLQAAAISSRLGVATLLEAHDEPQGKLGPWLFRQFLAGKGARRLLVTTHALARYLESQYDENRVKELVCHGPNGVDLDRYEGLPSPTDARQQLGFDQGFTAVYSGHLYTGRGAELMFELARRQPDIHFIWAGGTDEAVNYWKVQRDQQAVGNLSILGFVPNEELPMIQAAGEVLLMPYAKEIEISGGSGSARFANPMKVFEYMATGRAILASDLPMVREILDDEIARLLPPESVDAWQAELLSIKADDDARLRLGEKARAKASQFSWEQRAERALAGLEE